MRTNYHPHHINTTQSTMLGLKWAAGDYPHWIRATIQMS
jgi:hypothetical protein